MTEDQANALLGALEKQRNAALNALAQTEAALTLAQAEIEKMKKGIEALPEPEKPHLVPKEAP